MVKRGTIDYHFTYRQKTMTTKHPRGIILAKYKLADGRTVLKYRVRINRKKVGIFEDRYFDELFEAKEFLKNSQTVKGREIIWGITEAERVKKTIALDKNNYRFDFFIALYKQKYLPKREDFSELEKRNWNNKMSFLKTIENTSIPNRHISRDEAIEMGIDVDTHEGPIYTKLGAFDIRNIRPIEINGYVEERLKVVAKITVLREITSISNIYGKLTYFNENLVLPNPTFGYDKSLTRGATKKRTFTYSGADQKLLFDTLSSIENKTYFNVAMICLLTGLRRAEAILLKKDQVKENYITVEWSKGKYRDVYIKPEAQKFIASLPILNADKNRFFNLTIGGFEKMYRSYFDTPELKHLQRSHDLRRTNISRLITDIGLENSVVLTHILGIQNVASFEKNWSHKAVQHAPTNQKDAIKGFGHSLAQTTKTYFNFNVSNVKYTIKTDKD